MSRSIYVSLLVFLVVCFNSSTFGDSIRANGSISQPQPHLNDTKINILFLSVANDLPEGSAQLYFITTFQGTKTLLESGKPFTKFTNFEAKRCYVVDIVCVFQTLWSRRRGRPSTHLLVSEGRWCLSQLGWSQVGQNYNLAIPMSMTLSIFNTNLILLFLFIDLSLLVTPLI